MEPYAWPDPRLMQRLQRRVRAENGGRAFMAGGEALALGVLASRGDSGLPAWAEELADTMVGALLLVTDSTLDEATRCERVRLAVAAAVLSSIRPHARGACDAAIDTWMGWGVGPPDAKDPVDTLVGWALLCLLRRDAAAARCAVDALQDDGVGLILQDWTRSVIQGEPVIREAQCFHHLRTHMAHFDSRPAQLLMAAMVIQAGAGLRREGVLRWLDRVAEELATEGTSRCTPVPVAHRF